MTGIERGLALVQEGLETQDQTLVQRGFERFNAAVTTALALVKEKK